jgi:N-acetylglucosaminyldiphosphoundecaprenol N-acetyl-beta-D-mannosaminyltransferase
MQLNRSSSEFRILGIPISLLDLDAVINQMEGWIAQRDGSPHYIVCADSRLVMECRRDPLLMKAVESADLVLPDGMPLVWLARIRGRKQENRITGSDILLNFCKRAQRMGYTNFFYGGAQEVPAKLAQRLQEKLPGLQVVGTHSPPFRLLTPDENQDVSMMIEKASPDVLWIGLQCPKQEKWIYKRKDQLSVPVVVCIGAAFDFCSGTIRRAPDWMQRYGLEWLHRLLQEPSRLWYRYLVLGPRFVILNLAELIRLRMGFTKKK